MRDERRSGEDRRRPISAVVVDDDALVRSAIDGLLRVNDIEIAGSVGTGEAAIELVVDTRPDVVLMDLGLPGMSGLEAIERIGLMAPGTRVVVLTGSDRNHVVDAIVAGAAGYVLKSGRPQEIVDAVRATAGGESVISPAIAGQLLERIRAQKVAATDELAGAAIRSLLTARELDIFARLASGDSNQQIGRALCLSPNTVSNHIASLLAKLQLENRVQAAVQAVRSGIA